MALTIAEVEHVAHLARLRLSAEELEKMRTDLSAILDHIDLLKEVDVSDVAPTAQVTDLFNRFPEAESFAGTVVEFSGDRVQISL